jgi:hypothetical protein
MESASAVEPTAVKAPSTGGAATASKSTTAVKAASTIVAAAAIAASTIVAATAVIAAAAIAPAVEPRTSADEEAAYKVVRTVVSIRCASVRIITVVSVIADGRGIVVARTNTDAHGPLRIRVRGSNQGERQASTEKRQIF